MTAAINNPDAPFVPSTLLAQYSLPDLLPLPGAPVHLDLGTGLGHFLVDMARQYPQANWVGLEYDGWVVKNATRRVKKALLTNTLLFVREGRPFLLESVPPAGLDHLWINFPDPWPKTRHAERRHTHPWTLNLLVSRLRLGGELHLATDVPDYLAAMTEQAGRIGALAPATDSPWQRESLGIQTKYERKWRGQGRPLYYADWRKVEETASTAYPFAPQAAPPLRFLQLPPAGSWLDETDNRYQLNVLLSPKYPSVARLYFIDRLTGISTFGEVTAGEGEVQLRGAWTPWKIRLLERLV